MLLVLCIDLDDDVGRKTDIETPVVGDDAVREAAIALATADPEDSDLNVMFQGLSTYDSLQADGDEAVEVAVVTGVEGNDVTANRTIGDEIDTVLAGLQTGEEVSAIVITDGAQDESVIPIIRSRMPIDGVQRVVVRQAQNLESMYYTIKQVLADPETRGTILVPLGVLLLIYPMVGVLLLIYPMVVIAGVFDVAGAVVLGLLSALLGLYTLFRGLGLEDSIDATADRIRNGLYAGRATLITYVVALALVIVGGVQGVSLVETVTPTDSNAAAIVTTAAAFVHGSVQWFAAAGITSSLGQVTDEYLADRFRWRYLNAPFYVVAIAIVLYGLSGFLLPDIAGIAAFTLPDLAIALTVGTLLGVLSTLTFAVVESRYPATPEPA